MSEQSSTESETACDARYRHRLDVEIPTIKILLYADDPEDVTTSTANGKMLSLGLMIAHLMAHEPASARIRITYKCRYRRGNSTPVNKIHDLLDDERRRTGTTFDQIWFFGMHLTNLTVPSGGVFEGGPENELDRDEVSALLEWMRANEAEGFPGGGVLVTGDHSNRRPRHAAPGTNPLCPDTGGGENLLGLGRALGRCVPRAGLLRQWEGGPTNQPGNDLNTVGSPGSEFDAKPQRLIYQYVNELGEPDEQGQPHPLFYYKPGRYIECFPDHNHVGALSMPDSFDTEVWPLGLNEQPQPQPHVVAYGINQRTAERIDLIAAYHGDRAGVGRAVVDSTWHHYFNINLSGFPRVAPEDSAADQIGQFYANLAVWLSPRGVRRQMAHAILWELAKYTWRLERIPDDREPELNTGCAADNILSHIASACELHELLQVITPECFKGLKFPAGASALSYLPSRALLLGSIMCAYHHEMLRARDEENSYQPHSADEVITDGFIRAFKKQIEYLKWHAEKAEDALKLFNQ